MSSSHETPTAAALTRRLLSGDATAEADARDDGARARERMGANGLEEAEKPAKPPTGDAQCNFESTFRFMTERRLQRRYRGVYKQYSFTTQLVTWAVAIYTLSILATFAFGASYTSTDGSTSVTSESVFYAVLVIVVLYIFVRVALIIRWLMYWIIIAMMLGYALTGEVGAIFWLNDNDKLTKQQKRMRNGVAIALAIVEVLTIAVYYFTHEIYPSMVLKNKFDTVKWWNVLPHPTKTNTISYRSKARFYTKKRNVISYCGGLDDQNRPHGYGMWTDSSFHGERLTGQWEHGIPVGPYRSFEHGSGYCFVNIRVGYCHIRSEDRSDATAMMPKHSSDGIHWGVASVECSVSGGFFTFLPAVHHLTPYNGTGEDTPKCAADCEPLLRWPTDAVTFQSASSTPHATPNRRKSTMKRFQSARRLLYKENSCPTIDLPEDDASVSSAGTGAGSRASHQSTPAVEEKEAVILLHGYNCSLDYGMDRLAQLLALGDFPTSIHPFVFSWPSAGSALLYHAARDNGAQSDATAMAFRDFLRSLLDAGYTTIHLIAHSMGARVYFYGLNRGYFWDLFEQNESFVGDADVMAAAAAGPTIPQRRLRMATLTLTNADYERDDFVRRGGGYDRSRRICPIITVYADNMDGALFFAEIFCRKSLCGPLAYSLGKRGHMLYRDAEDAGSRGGAGSFSSDDELSVSVGVRPYLTRNEMDLAIAVVNQRGQFAGVKSFAYNHERVSTDVGDSEADRQSALESLAHLDDGPREYLDIDVIDTTWMDNNVHSIRHNYFNLNPTLVEDLRCLIVNRERASSRPGLLKTRDNVYIFLVAPSHVKNK